MKNTPSRISALLALLLLSTIGLGCAFNRGRTEGEAQADAKVAVVAKDAKADAAAADKARDRTIAQASSNLGPIADVVEAKGQPAMAEATRIQKGSIDRALALPIGEYPLPTVSTAELLKNANEAVAKYRTQVETLQADLASKNAIAADSAKKLAEAEAVAEAERKKADAAERSALLWKIGGGILTGLGVLAGIASRLGLPYASLVESLFSVINPMVKARRVTAETGLAAADVGRQTLGVVEQLIANKHPDVATKVMEVISSATGGRAETMTDLFKVAAKAYVTDNAGTQVTKVDNLLNDIRGRVLETEGGVATAVANIVKT